MLDTPAEFGGDFIPRVSSCLLRSGVWLRSKGVCG